MPKIIVVGSINMDVVCFVDHLPGPGETIIAKELRYFPGGKGSNQAVAGRRLGAAVQMVGRIGQDDFGIRMADFLGNEGVDIALVRGVEGPTGTAFITVDAASENSIVVIPGANERWAGWAADELSIQSADIVVGEFEIPQGVTCSAFEKAKQVGATTVLNPAPMMPIADSLLTVTDILVLNETELAMLSQKDMSVVDESSVAQAATAIRQKGIDTVVVTLGARGARVFSSGESIEVQGLAVKAIDTTGAGDCFVGAFAAELSRGSSLRDAAIFANKAAAVSVMRVGAASSMPNRSEL